MTDAVSRSSDQIGDDAVLKQTGRSRDEWRAMLGAAGANEWEHSAIASWLVSEHGVDGWWAQGLTVDYEQFIGRRKPGQRADGTFEATASRTLRLEQQEVLDAVVASVRAEVGFVPASVNNGGKFFSARWKLDDGRAVLASVSPTTADGKTRIALTMSGLTAEGDLASAKAALVSWLPVVG